MLTTWSPERRFGLGLAGLVLLASLPHVGTLWLGFALDDESRIVSNPDLGDWSQAPRLLSEMWRPLKRLSLMLDHALFGLDPRGYHLTNLLLHVAATLALAVLWRRLTGRPGLALVAAALFAVHPVHVEAIANITNRKEMMATLGAALAFLAYLGPRRPLARFGLVALWFAAALLSKESAAIMLPAILALYELAYREPRSASARRQQLVAVGVAAALLALALAAFGIPGRLATTFSQAQIRWVSSNDTASYAVLALNAPRALLADLRLLVWPWPLSVLPRFELVSDARDARCIGALAALVASVGLVAWLRRRARWASFGLAWTLLSLVPFLNLVPLTWWFAAERFLYLPSAGFCLFLAHLALGLPHAVSARPRLARAAALMPLVAALVVAALASAWRVRAWQDSLSIVAAALRTDRDEWRAYHWACVLLRRRERPVEAEAMCRRATELKPGFPFPYAELARLALGRDELDAAIPLAETAVRLDPFPDKTLGLLAGLYVRAGRAAEALPLLERALAARPHDWRLAVDLAETSAHLGRRAEARAILEQLGPERAAEPEVLVAGARIAIQEGRPSEARAGLVRALEARPGDLTALLALADLERSLGDGAAARSFLEQALATPEGARRRGAIALRFTALTSEERHGQD